MLHAPIPPINPRRDGAAENMAQGLPLRLPLAPVYIYRPIPSSISLG
jgi:hypothetical protein